MISFRDREDVGPAIVSIVSILVLIGGFLFLTFVKPPTGADIARIEGKKTLEYKTTIKNSTATAAKSQVLVNKQTWTGDAEAIGTSALEAASELANKHGIKLTVFRNQRPALVDNLVGLPFVITVEGTFLGVLTFERDLEDPKNRIAVTQIQISSSDPNTNKVTANIGIVAYVNPKEEMPIQPDSTSLQSKLDSRRGGPKKNA